MFSDLTPRLGMFGRASAGRRAAGHVTLLRRDRPATVQLPRRRAIAAETARLGVRGASAARLGIDVGPDYRRSEL